MAKQKNAALNFMTGTYTSKYKEQFSEYFFLKDIMLAAASQNTLVIVARSDFDAFGFDLLLSKQTDIDNWVSVRVQLKATFNHKSWDIHKSLLHDPSGRIIVIELSADDTNIIPTYYSFNRTHINTALSRLPKVAHINKCQVRLGNGEFTNITKNLLALFD